MVTVLILENLSKTKSQKLSKFKELCDCDEHYVSETSKSLKRAIYVRIYLTGLPHHYVDETSRSLNVRMKEHKDYIKREFER